MKKYKYTLENNVRDIWDYLFDKARGPGGRSSFKRKDEAKGYDHGTQNITPKSQAIKS